MTSSVKASACSTPALVRLGLGSWALRGGALGRESAQTLLASIRTKFDVRTLLLLALIYTTTLALPFGPGMELGLLLMVALGPRGIGWCMRPVCSV